MMFRCLLLFGALPFASAVHGQALAATIPANAKVVVIVRNLDALLEHSNQFVIDGCGLPAPRTEVSQITDLLGRLGSAWKTERGVAFVATELTGEGVAVLLPVGDAASALARMGGEADAGTTKFDLVGKTLFGLAQGEVLTLGTSGAAVRAIQTAGDRLSTRWNARQKQFAETDQVFFYVNLQELKPELEKLAAESDKLGELLTQLPGDMRKLDPQRVAEALKRIAQGLGREGQALYGSLNWTREVATLRLAIEFKEGSRAKSMLANFQPSSAELFAKLPEANFVAAFGLDAKTLVQGTKVGGLAEDLGVVALGAALTDGKSGLALLGRATAADAGTLNQTLGGLLALAPLAAANRPELKLTSGKRQLDGLEVGELAADLAGLPTSAKEPLQALLGGTTMRFQHASLGDAVGMCLSARTDAWAELKAGGNLAAAARVQEVTRHLPKGAVFAALFDPLAALRTAQRLTVAAQLDQPLATVSIPADPGAPFALAATLGPEGAALHFVAPSAAIKKLVPVLQALGK